MRSRCAAAAALLLLLLLLLSLASSTAGAQSGDSVVLPHVVLTAGVGGQLRLATDTKLAQERLAPSYADAMLGATFDLGGVSLGAGIAGSVNLESDGGYTEPVFAFQQWSITPVLLLHQPLGHDWLLLAHAGPSFALQGPAAIGRDQDRQRSVTLGSAGAELGAAGAYRLLAGVLAYAELDVNMWVGEGRDTHWVAALEGGVMLDYEVLP